MKTIYSAHYLHVLHYHFRLHNLFDFTAGVMACFLQNISLYTYIITSFRKHLKIASYNRLIKNTDKLFLKHLKIYNL